MTLYNTNRDIKWFAEMFWGKLQKNTKYFQRGCGIMTIQQQACNRILKMSDEGAAFINQVINKYESGLFR